MATWDPEHVRTCEKCGRSTILDRCICEDMKKKNCQYCGEEIERAGGTRTGKFTCFDCKTKRVRENNRKK